MSVRERAEKALQRDSWTGSQTADFALAISTGRGLRAIGWALLDLGDATRDNAAARREETKAADKRADLMRRCIREVSG